MQVGAGTWLKVDLSFPLPFLPARFLASAAAAAAALLDDLFVAAAFFLAASFFSICSQVTAACQGV